MNRRDKTRDIDQNQIIIQYAEDFGTWDVWNDQQQLSSWETKEQAEQAAESAKYHLARRL